jgi:hypothetical protein
LADFQSLSRANEGNRYLLVMVDVLSRRVFVAPVKSKKPLDIILGFEKINMEVPMVPLRLFTDKGCNNTCLISYI